MLFKKTKNQLPEKKECLHIKVFENNKNIFLLSKKQFDSIKDNLSDEKEKIILLKENQIIEIGEYILYEERGKKKEKLLNKKREIKEKKIDDYEKLSKQFIKKWKEENEKKEMDELFEKFNFKSDENGLCHLPITVGQLINMFNAKKNKINTLSDDVIRIKKPFSQKREELFNRIKQLSKNQVLEIAQLLNINNVAGAKTLIIEDIKKKNYSTIRKKVEEFEKINKNNPNFKSFEEYEKEIENKKKEEQRIIQDNNLILNDSQISESLSDEEI